MPSYALVGTGSLPLHPPPDASFRIFTKAKLHNWSLELFIRQTALSVFHLATCLQSMMLNDEFGHQGVRQLVLLHALFSPDHQAFDRSLLACGIPRGEWCRPCWPWLSAGSRRWSQHAKALEDLFANLFNWYLWSICYLANLEQMRTKACGRLTLATLMDFSQLGKKRHKTASN